MRLGSWDGFYSLLSRRADKKAHFLQGQENGKGGSLETRARFYFSSTAPNLPKLQCYTNFVFSAIIGKTRNGINNFVQFYVQNGLKPVKS
jgi:hypothetical protein